MADNITDLAQARLDRASANEPLLKKTSGDGTSGGMLEARVARLEDDMKEVKGDIKAMRTDLSYIRGKVDAMPTTLQLIAFVVAIFAAAGIARFFH